MFILRLKSGEENRIGKQYRNSQAKMNTLGLFMLEQVKLRFETAGVSGGEPWAPKWLKKIGADDGRAILTGPTGDLLNSFSGYGLDGHRAIVDSVSPYARIHQLGTVGKGGVLPTIRPKTAKALFIPLTDKAFYSERLTGSQAALLRTGQFGGVRYSGSPVRAYGSAVGYKPGKSLGMTVYTPLVKGRLKDGKLQRLDPILGWVDGIPDFIFLSKSDVPPRRMLPTSNQERVNQKRLIVSLFGPPRLR